MNDLADKIPSLFLKSFDDGMKQAVHMLWSILLTYIKGHWIILGLIFFIVLVVATIKALGGYWGTLGSIIYNFLYFGVLFLIGLIWGPEVFINDFFNLACAIILYPICYYLTGLILRRTGVL